MPELTALRRAGPGKIALEVDGRPWRTVADDVVVRAGLATGVELDRPTLRRLRAELLRTRAVRTAGRALARGDLSSTRLAERLDRARIRRAVAAGVLADLERVGAIDDARAGRARARALAARGWGDRAIEARLEAEGFSERDARTAVEELQPEEERARALLAGEADATRAARRLARRGFAGETVEALLGGVD